MKQEDFGNNLDMKTNTNGQFCQNTLLDTIKSKIFVDDSKTKNGNIENNLQLQKNIVVVCFGTPLISGDAFAPLVAEALKASGAPVFVYGTQKYSVNGKNMEVWLDFIREVHKDCMILAIDASLGEKVGTVVVRKDGVCPAAIKGRKRRYGDVGVLGVVAKNQGDALMQLMSASYDFVEKMALDTANVIISALANAL